MGKDHPDNRGNPPLLVVEDVSMDYRQSDGARLPVLENVSFQVTEGEFLCLVGTSGHGKSTLLRLIAGLERPRSGRIWLAGQVVDRPRRSVGIVFQKPTLMGWRTVEANVALPLELNGCCIKEEALQRARALIDLVGLSGFESAYPAQLSGGMAQRVALARALVHDPQMTRRSCSWTSRSARSTRSRASRWGANCCASGRPAARPS